MKPALLRVATEPQTPRSRVRMEVILPEGGPCYVHLEQEVTPKPHPDDIPELLKEVRIAIMTIIAVRTSKGDFPALEEKNESERQIFGWLRKSFPLFVNTIRRLERAVLSRDTITLEYVGDVYLLGEYHLVITFGRKETDQATVWSAFHDCPPQNVIAFFRR